jgi:hypothetical protein
MDLDLLFVLLIIFLPIIATIYIRISYSRNLKKLASNGLTGYDVARKILDKNGLEDLIIVETGGTLSDHYDPTRKVVRLSKDIYHGTSVASNAVAAHEVGHAIQDKEGYFFLKLRHLIFPVINILSNISYYVILIGFIFELINLVWFGIAAVAAGLFFQIITLPVEINASKRAESELDALGIVSKEDKEGIKNMLTAAALTYVAGVLAGIIQLLRLINIASDNN